MNPMLIQTPYFALSSLWTFNAVAMVVCVLLLIKIGGKNGLKIQFFNEHAWSLFFWALGSGRLFYLIENYHLYFLNWDLNTIFSLFQIWDGGVNFWGFFIGFLISFWYLCFKENQNFFKWLDLIMPILLIGYAIVSIGAFFEGTSYGNESDLPWAINLESPAIKYAIPIHPTQIYAFIYSSLLAILFFFLREQPKINAMEKAGFIGELSLCTFAFAKFLEEFVRGDDTLMIATIRLPQILWLLCAIITGILLFLRYNERKLTNDRHEHTT